MSIFGDRRRRGSDSQYQPEHNELEFYEDAHNMSGYNSPETQYNTNEVGRNYQTSKEIPKNLPNMGQAVTPRNYQNLVVYKPSTPDDVQTLIDFLKRREPAIVNLDEVEENSAQRVLDFVSGAIYALNGSIHRIAGNIFLISPEGVEVAVPYEDKK